jgi:protein TonB
MQENRLPDPAEPRYPAGAQQEHTEGDVDIAVVIAPDGSVTSAKLVRGMPFLQEAALEFVRASKFKPFLLSGTPVEVHTTARIVFESPTVMGPSARRR